jgi:nucleotide-binding universal stress UspA family protein
MNHFPTRILLATDGSECAQSAGRVAVDLANRMGAEFDVVHTFEFVALRMCSTSECVKQGREVLDAQVGRIQEMEGVEGLHNEPQPGAPRRVSEEYCERLM